MVASARDDACWFVCPDPGSSGHLDSGSPLDGRGVILNGRLCGRTHCHYTGPYYIAMIVPVLGLGIISSGIYEWIALGVAIVVGSKVIWWATERAWGKLITLRANLLAFLLGNLPSGPVMFRPVSES